MNEIWKQINGYKGIYEISNLGRVNLEWVTKKQNINYTFRNGKYPIYKISGENCGASKLKEEEVILIRKLHKDKNLNYIELGKIFKVDSTTIGNIIRRNTWKLIS